MDVFVGGLAGGIGALAFFGFLAFATWIDYRKKKDEREAAHRERMKALELGYPPQDAEIERARAYRRAAWAAGLIGLLVPLGVAVVAAVLTIVALRQGMPLDPMPVIVGWSIAGFIMLATILRSLSVIRQLPRPTGEPAHRVSPQERHPDASAVEFQEKRIRP
jgi:hypothetical protein